MRRYSLLKPAILIGFSPALALLACAPDPDPGPPVEICDNGKDDDGDGQKDCFDPDCREDIACTSDEQEVLCKDLIDNDGDGLVDCDDPDCEDSDSCVPKSEKDRCDDGKDNDRDGLTDCADDDCDADLTCVEVCGDGIDNDANGYTDCEDHTCKGEPECDEGLHCDDGIDNDLDDDIDCADRDCRYETVCDESISCEDGKDNDADGLIDCEDADCTDSCDETCDDGVDNDADDYVDCYDDECWGLSHCLPVDVWVNTARYWRSNKILNVNKTWVDGEYGGTVSTETREATASTISGSLQIDRGAGLMTCQWTLDEATFTQNAAGIGRIGGRDGWATSGGCMVESGVLPHFVSIGWYPDADLRVDSDRRQIWYDAMTSHRRDVEKDSSWGYTWVVTSHTALVHSTAQTAVIYTSVQGGGPVVGFANP